MVGAQVWLDQNYPVNGTCQRKEDKENYGKKLEEIINLDISDRGLEGELILYSKDHVAARFPNLRTLNISFNSLSKVTWPDDGQINQDYLEVIDWSHNQFSGDDPRNSIRSFPKLRIANISYNSIVTNFSVFDNGYLTKLDCSNNHLVSIALKNNSNLQELDCSNNPIVSLSFDVNAFSKLNSFNCLGINFNSSSGLIPPSANTSNLSKIFIPSSVIGFATGVGITFAGISVYRYVKKNREKWKWGKLRDSENIEENGIILNDLLPENRQGDLPENSSDRQGGILDDKNNERRNDNLVLKKLPQKQADGKSNWRASFTDEKPVLGSLLGKGGYGEVYRGKWGLQDVAIKKLYLSLNNISQNESDVKEILNEVNILKNLRNKYIIQYYGFYSDDQESLIIMEYAKNGDLTKFINKNENKYHDWNLNAELIRQMACGLDYIHQQKIIHRDLKSMNILLIDGYNVKISDFGLSKTKNISSSQSTHSMTGTLRWMAPELFKGQKHSEHSDIYALGMIIWEITKRCTEPFKDIDYKLIALHITSGGRENIPNDTPKNIQDIIQQCWKDNPNERITLEKILEIIGTDKLDNDRKSSDAKGLSKLQSSKKNNEEPCSDSLNMNFMNFNLKDNSNQTKQEQQSQIEIPPK